MEPRRLVYILRNDVHPDRHYVGVTSDVEPGSNGTTPVRLVTLDHRQWSVVVSLAFTDARTAARFERNLRTGPGRAFAKRHFKGEKAVTKIPTWCGIDGR